MSLTFSIKQHDLRPRFRVQLTETAGPSNSSSNIDLTLATGVRMILKGIEGSSTVLEVAASFVDKPRGIVEYRWQEGDTDIVGVYQAEFEIDWDGEPQTFPSNGYLTVRINPDLG